MAEILIPSNGVRVQYTASSGQTVFPYTFPIFDETHIKVVSTVSGTSTTLAIATNYTVSGVGILAGGNITLLVGATAGDIITLERVTPYARNTDFQTSGDFRADTINRELDLIVMQLQQLKRDNDRTITLKTEDNTSFIELPTSTERASKLFGFDATGAVLMEEGLAISKAAAAASAAAAATSETNAATSASAASTSASSAATDAATASAQVPLVQAEGTTQIAAVNTAGTTQVSAVNTAGATQIAAVNTSGSTAMTSYSGILDSGRTMVQRNTAGGAYTASNLETIVTDNTAGGFTITLPLSPSAGDTVVIMDGVTQWAAANFVTVARNGETINNTAEDLLLNDAATVRIVILFYTGSDWMPVNLLGA